jgi:hypothetical protein
MDAMQGILNHYDTYGDSSLRTAERALQTLEDKVRDRYLSQREKVNVARDCSRVFKDSVRQSEAYRFEDRSYHGVSGILLGETAHFSKSKIETRSVVLSQTRSFGALRLKALDDSLALVEIVICFEGGREIRFSNLSLSENQSMVLSLKGRRRVTEIRATGSSAVIWGTKAKLQVSGIE